MLAPCSVSSTGEGEVLACHLLNVGEHKVARQVAQHNAGSIDCAAGNKTMVYVWYWPSREAIRRWLPCSMFSFA